LSECVPTGRGIHQSRHPDTFALGLEKLTASRIGIFVLLGRPQRITKLRDMRRRIKEPAHRPRNTSLIALARIEQSEPLQCCQVARANFHLDQHATVPTSIAKCFISFSCLFTALCVGWFGHGVVQTPLVIRVPLDATSVATALPGSSMRTPA
jgi:hypothetical protein